MLIVRSSPISQSDCRLVKNEPNSLFAGDTFLREITENVQLRHDAELRRAELVQRANDLQTRIKEKREKITRVIQSLH